MPYKGKIRKSEYMKKWAELHPNYFSSYGKRYSELHPGRNAENGRKFRQSHAYMLMGGKQVWVSIPEAILLDGIKPEYRSLDILKKSAVEQMQAIVDSLKETEGNDA